MGVVYICIALVILLGVPFTLLWWRTADRWAAAEHKRFKPKPDLSNKIVIPTPRSDAPPPPPR